MMKFERGKEWWLARARREGDAPIGAGLLAADPPFKQEPAAETTAAETRIAFSRFVQLMRRQRGESVEKLAEEAELDVVEIMNIEEGLDYTPEPRTVYQLARIFNVPQFGLMELAGLVSANDASFRAEAVRFAARSESVQKLSREEKTALEAFIAVLSKRAESKTSR